LIGFPEQRFDVPAEREDAGQPRRPGVDESAACLGHRGPGNIGQRDEAFVFLAPLARLAAVVKSKLDALRLVMIEGGLPVRLDHVINRIRPDWHGQRLGDVCGLRGGREGAGACDRGHGEEMAPRRVAGTSGGDLLQTCLWVAC
jgi:hypothetical protein